MEIDNNDNCEDECEYLHQPEILRIYMWADKGKILTGFCPYCHNKDEFAEVIKNEDLFICKSCNIKTSIKNFYKQIAKNDDIESNSTHN